MARQAQHRRRRISDGGSSGGGFDWGELAIGAAVGGIATYGIVSLFGGTGGTKNVGTEVDVLPNNPWAYVGSAIPIILAWALFF